MSSLEKRFIRVRYLFGHLSKRVPRSSTSAVQDERLRLMEVILESALEDEGVTLASGGDCPESDPNCIPSEPPPGP